MNPTLQFASQTPCTSCAQLQAMKSIITNNEKALAKKTGKIQTLTCELAAARQENLNLQQMVDSYIQLHSEDGEQMLALIDAPNDANSIGRSHTKTLTFNLIGV